MPFLVRAPDQVRAITSHNTNGPDHSATSIPRASTVYELYSLMRIRYTPNHVEKLAFQSCEQDELGTLCNWLQSSELVLCPGPQSLTSIPLNYATGGIVLATSKSGTLLLVANSEDYEFFNKTNFEVISSDRSSVLMTNRF